MTATTQAGDLTVQRTATTTDAALIVQLMNGPLGERAADGMELLLGYDTPPTWEQFDADHPQGSPGRKQVKATLSFNETLGTFVKRGLLDRALVHDLFWIAGAWDRSRAIALHYREASGEPAIYENFEALAQT
jgi:hypothetical protein